LANNSALSITHDWLSINPYCTVISVFVCVLVCLLLGLSVHQSVSLGRIACIA